MKMLLKNFVRLATFVAFIFVVSCTKEDLTTDLFSDENATAVNELVASGSGGPGGDSTHTGTGNHSHGWRSGHREHPGHSRGDNIAFSGLPEAAKTYLLANKDTAKITRIAKVTLRDSSVRYGVRLSDGTHVHFDANGAVVATPTDRHVFTEITFVELPATAQTYVLSKTTADKIAIVTKVTKPDGTVFYSVRLTDNTHFAFDSTGAVVTKGTGRKRRH